MSLFEEFKSGRFHAKNHFARAASKEQICSPDGHIPNEIYDFYEKLAAGGLGTIIVSSARVKLFDGTKPQGMFRLDRHELLPEYRKLADIGHRYGATMIIQESFSKFKDIDKLEDIDFERIVNLHAEAALFAKEAGFDGVELHEAHGTLMFLGMILKPATNQRSDAYGQDRGLLIEKIVKQIRRYAGDDFIIMSKEDCGDEQNGYSEQMALEHCLRLEKAGIDCIEVSGPTVTRGKDDRYEVSYFRDFAIRLKKELSIPVMLVGGNKDLEIMEKLNEEEGIDLFSLSRISSREFDIVNRWQSGDRSPSKCRLCNACGKTFGHLCPFNPDNPFDFRQKPFYDMSGNPLRPYDLMNEA